MALVHEAKCGVCGAPRTAEADGYFVMCAHRGAMMDVDVGSWFDPIIALSRAKDDRTLAAKLLGISRRTLDDELEEHRIP